MKGNQAELCQEVLRRLHDAGVLKDIIVIGSWCQFFYRSYFSGEILLSPLRTRDIDLLVPHPGRMTSRANVPNLLEDLGFVLEHSHNGYNRLLHSELMVEFLVPEKGRGSEKPVPLRNLAMNGQPLRFLSMLAKNPISVTLESGIPLTLPHPIHYAFQKILIAGRHKDKGGRDIQNALDILGILIERNQSGLIMSEIKELPPKWRKTIETEMKKDSRFSHLGL